MDTPSRARTPLNWARVVPYAARRRPADGFQHFGLLAGGQRELGLALELGGIAGGKPFAVDFELASDDVHICLSSGIERHTEALGAVEEPRVHAGIRMDEH